MGHRLHIDEISGKVGCSKGSALKRLALGFALGCLLLGLAWAAQGLAAGAGNAEPSRTKAAEPTTVGSSNETTKPEPAAPKQETPAVQKGWSEEKPGNRSVGAASLSPFQVGSVLLVLIVFAAAFALLLRRFLRRARLAPGKRKVLELVDAMPIGPKRFVYVINLEGRTLVVGAGGDQVNLLAEYGEDEWPQAREESTTETAAAPAPRKEPGQATRTHRQPLPEDTPRVHAGVASNGAAEKRQLSRAAEAYREAGEAQSDDGTVPAAHRPELPGAHRVPRGFRHLLERAMEESREA